VDIILSTSDTGQDASRSGALAWPDDSSIK